MSAGPVIPNFGEASPCVAENRLFCTGWVRDNWSDVLQPALVEHVELTLIAVAVGLVISLVAALVTHRYRLLERPFGAFAAILCFDRCVEFIFPSFAQTRIDLFRI